MVDTLYDSKILMTIKWESDRVVMIDQTQLPNKLEYFICNSYLDVAYAIKNLIIRGAPAIGVAGALGFALAAIKSTSTNKDDLIKELNQAYKVLRSTRPTAINLKWGLDRVMKKIEDLQFEQIPKATLNEALRILEEDISINKRVGMNGSVLFNSDETVMTHCNAGSLATVAYGTALGVIRSVKESGKRIKVIATETRPVMQGSRLTAFELQHEKIDVSLIPDTAVGYIMSKGLVDKVIVGADRVLSTGHVFNKIGTYQIALLSKLHNIPFYVAAPTSTFDLISKVEDVVIEERNKEEVTRIGDRFTAPKDIPVINPAFDMTPPDLITGIITEKGIIKSPYDNNIRSLITKNIIDG